MKAYLIKTQSKKFTSRLYPRMLGDLTLDILASISKNNGYGSVQLLPEVLSKRPLLTNTRLESMIYEYGDFFGFSCNIGNVLDSINFARLISADYTGSTIVFGGPHFDSISSRIILQENPHINYILIGPAEINFGKFLKSLKERNFSSVPGLFYRENAQVISNPIDLSFTQRDLDSLEIPFLDKIDSSPLEERANITVPIRTSLGCNGFCSFCYLPFKGWTGMSANRVKDIFDYYTNKGFRKFLIVDDNFPGSDLNRIQDLAKSLLEIKKNNPDFEYEFDARADSFGNYKDDSFNHELIELLIQSGLKNIFVGIESGNNPDLRYFRKSSVHLDPLKQNIYFLSQINRYQVNLTPGFIMMTELSDEETISQNIDFIGQYLPPQISPEIYWYKLSYYSGSELTRRKIRELKEKGDSDTIRDIVYGTFRPTFKDQTAQAFSIVLDKVKKRFSDLEDRLDLGRDERERFLERYGDYFRRIHTLFFKTYLEYAKSGRIEEVDNILEDHYNSISLYLPT